MQSLCMIYKYNYISQHHLKIELNLSAWSKNSVLSSEVYLFTNYSDEISNCFYNSHLYDLVTTWPSYKLTPGIKCVIMWVRVRQLVIVINISYLESFTLSVLFVAMESVLLVGCCCGLYVSDEQQIQMS